MRDEAAGSIETQSGHHLATLFGWMMKVFLTAVILGFQSR
jgi:hypothetical protein